MNQEELLVCYRELDHDLARLSRFQIGEEKEEGPLLPTKENMDRLWNVWRELKKRVGQLETPDAFLWYAKTQRVGAGIRVLKEGLHRTAVFCGIYLYRSL